MARNATICTGPAFGVDNAGTLRIRQPQEAAWPYETPIEQGNGLFQDEQQGLWVPPQDRNTIRRDPDNHQKANTGQVAVAPKDFVFYPFDDITVTNHSAGRMRVHLLLHVRTYVILSDNTTNKSVGALDFKVWYDTDPEPSAWEEYATAFSGSFSWRTTFVVDASTWAEPQQTRTIHSSIRYRNAEGSVTHQVQAMEMKPVGFTFVPFPSETGLR
ncbi:hypothetical protein AB0J38_14445 [Streptomyces sp. NPDC050095]|uniref:hypothetical protein n=1 Tax=unclassified Streptomyces TaxID=2593676 RepID=UPI00341FA496